MFFWGFAPSSARSTLSVRSQKIGRLKCLGTETRVKGCPSLNTQPKIWVPQICGHRNKGKRVPKGRDFGWSAAASGCHAPSWILLFVRLLLMGALALARTLFRSRTRADFLVLEYQGPGSRHGGARLRVFAQHPHLHCTLSRHRCR